MHVLFTHRNKGGGAGGGGGGGGAGGGGGGAGGGALMLPPASWFQLAPTCATTIGIAKAIEASMLPDFENACRENRAVEVADTPMPPPAHPESGLGAAKEWTDQSP